MPLNIHTKLLHTHTGLNRTDGQAQLKHTCSLAPSLHRTSPGPTGNTADAPETYAELLTRERQKCENAGKERLREPQLPFIFFLIKKATECGGPEFPTTQASLSTISPQSSRWGQMPRATRHPDLEAPG